MPSESTRPPVPEHFNEELLDKHLYYTYSNGWRYEAWLKSHDRIVYAIHSTPGVKCPLDGRKNFQTIYPQRIRPNLWQVSWMEETGSQVTICIDLDEHRITSFIALSYGHFNEADKAKGWKREKMEQWKELAKIKPEPESRELLPETAKIEKITRGRDDLPDIELEWPTL